MKNILFILLIQSLIYCSSLSKSSSSDFSFENDEFQIISPLTNPSFGKAQKQTNGITYLGDFGEFYKYEFIVLADEDLDKLKNGTVKESDLLYFFGNNHYFKNLILPSIPKAKIIHDDLLKDSENKFNYAMILFLPSASSFTINDKRQDIHRGGFMFRQNQYLFLLQSQEDFEIEVNGVSKRTPKSKEEIIKELVKKFFFMKTKIKFK